jgi:hypothetical protein
MVPIYMTTNGSSLPDRLPKCFNSWFVLSLPSIDVPRIVPRIGMSVVTM